MKKKITFSRLVDKVAKETGASKKLIHDLLVETIALNQEGLKRDRHNSITGFGRFSLKWHKARKGRNPQSGETIDIPGHNTVNFKPQASLRKHINRHYSQLKPQLIESGKKAIPNETIPPIIKKDIPLEVKKTEEIPQPKTKPIITEIKQGETLKTNEVLEQRPEEKQKKPINRWIWPIILFLFIILFYVFWPSSESTDTVVQEKPTTEKITAKEEPIVETPIEEEKTVKIPAKEIATGIPASKYKLQEGDYLFSIARYHYKEARYWPLIYMANKSLAPNPEIVITGGEIILPALEGNPKNLSLEDKKNLSQGYLEVYLYYKNKDRKKAIYHLWVAKKINIADVFKKYEDHIDDADLILVNTMEGSLMF